MDDSKTVCFACFTQTNVVMSYILSKTIYKDYYKILILSDWNCKELYLNIVDNTTVWDRVVLIKEAGKMDRKDRFNKIELQLNGINFHNVDELIYYQLNQHSYLNIIFNYLSNKTKLIIPAFTVSTHYVKEYFKYLNNYYSSRNIDIHIDYKKITEIWSYNKNLYVGNLGDVLLKEVKIIKYIRDNNLLIEFCNELNKIFNYDYKPLNYDFLFLEQPLKRFFNKENEEIELLKKVLDKFSGYNTLIKLHPSVNTSINKYDGLNVSVIEDNKVPWEVIFLNELKSNNMNNKIFVSYFSETIYTTHAFLIELNIPHKVFMLQGILEKERTNDTQIGDEMVKLFNKVFMHVYGNSFYNITHLNQLKNLSR